MDVLDGNYLGPIVVAADTTLSGNLMGDAIVRPAARFWLSGNMSGDIVLEDDAQAWVTGNLGGVIRRVVLRATARG